jgi:hypothetical protein
MEDEMPKSSAQREREQAMSEEGYAAELKEQRRRGEPMVGNRRDVPGGFSVSVGVEGRKR